LVGEFPVYQEITFTLSAHLQAHALTAINSKVTENTSETISFGIRYNPATKEWESIAPTDAHHESLTADLSVMGEVDSEIRLIPNVEVKFYKVLAANLSIEPTILGKIQDEVVADVDFLTGYIPTGTAQFTTFDASLHAQCFVGANLKIISKEFPLLSKTQVCDWPVYHIFSLPTLELGSSGTGDGAYSLTATVKDGANDPFSDGSIKWFLYPETAGKLLPKGRLATFTPSTTPTTDKATIFFSGYGKLGEFGRQFVHTEIPLSPKTDEFVLNPTECIEDPR